MYSNSIISSLQGLIGWRAWHNSDVPSLISVNTNTSSGRYWNDSNGIVSLENIQACMPDGIPINDFLQNLSADVIIDSLDSVIRRKKLDRQTKEVIKDNYMFNGAGRVVDTITKNGRFVGYQIQLALAHGLKLVIDEITTQFDTTQVDFPIRVFHSSQVEPLKTVLITRAIANSVETHNLTGNDVINLTYVDSTHSSGGYFWIGYFEDDLTGMAINRNQNITNINGCGGCGVNFAKARDGFTRITPFYVKQENLNGSNTWDRIHTNEVNNNSYGLNFRMNVVCDLSDWILKNKSVFTEIFLVKMKKKVLELYFNSNNINNIKGFSVDRVAYTIKEMEKEKEIENAIDNANFEMEGNSPCFPYVRRNHVTYGSL